ncbi:hypothetical protein EJ06DRAFT_558982 [Trichodelitschia bisporula]|uniref:Phosphoribosylaminoimidazole-succinocarboxamide synthase n=1 Tax=Trichodelitschia bisporula TaxID=703511 RepID=A0A6G1HND7_9PEZI|nr:hypothetical protein EJ06DRAFT_558982 [Trichodelitschia bisporula]
MSLTPEPFDLKHTNVSRPQLAHSNSKQSVAASEDYYSFSDNASDVTEGGVRLNPFHTPSRTPEASSSGLIRPIASRQRLAASPSTPPIEEAIARGAIVPHTRSEQKSLLDTRRPDPMNPNITPATTPDVDDTPYIHFALDQLTRDEEVRGSRRYPGHEATTHELEQSEHSRGAILPYEEEHQVVLEPSGKAGKARVSTEKSRPSFDDDRRAPAYDEEDIYAQAFEEESPKSKRDLAQQKEMQAGLPPKHPVHDRSNSSTSVVQYDVFMPYNPRVATYQYPNLNFLPAILRPAWLSLFIIICAVIAGALIFSAVWSHSHDGLIDYLDFGDARYFVFQYLPTMVGMFVLLWLFQIETAVQRISPFMAMASPSTKSRTQGAFLDLYPTQFLVPKLQHFRAGQPIIGVCFLVFWLFLFTIPLLASAFNVRFIGAAASGAWRWIAVQGVIWTAAVLYILLTTTLILLAAKLWRSRTGLKWDPRSLADIIALIERANIMNDYVDTEIFASRAELRQRLWTRSDRLGYWHTSRRPQDIFYGLGEEGGATRRYSVEQGRIREKVHHPASRSSTSSFGGDDVVRPERSSVARERSDMRNPDVRRRYMPWFLSSTSILALTIVAFVLLIAFYVIAFLKRTSTRGFDPRLGATANKDGFSAANFTYSFVPAIIGFALYLLWLPLDLAHRRLAAFAAMAGPNGASAEKSLLTDYPYLLPGSVTLSALSNGHYKVALLSFISLTNVAIPILAGGIFWTQWYPNQSALRVSAHPAGLYALCVFLALYAVGLLALWPGRRSVALPHDARCLAELLSWVYMSPLLVDRAFSRCGTKAELVGRLVGSAPEGPRGFFASMADLVGSRARVADVEKGHAGERRGEVRYGFGVYVGRDGLEHLGVDRTVRAGRQMVLFEGGRGRGSWMGF